MTSFAPYNILKSVMKSFFLVAMAAIIMSANPCIAATMPSIGSRPPLLSLPNLQNKTVNISDYSNYPIILTFFTSWSKSCQSELKALNELSLEFKNTGLKVVGVSFDKKDADLAGFVSLNKIGFDLLIDKKLRSLDKFGVLILPTTFVIDRKGNITDIFVDYDDNVEKALRKFVSSQTAK